MKTKFVVGLITSFEYIDKVINTYKLILNELSNEFNEVYIINNDNLKFFRSKKKYKIKKKKKLDKKIIFYNPKNASEFNKFVENKKIILINSFGRSFSEMKTHFLLNKRNIHQIMISNIGNIQGSNIYVGKNIITNLFLKKISHYLTLIFYGMGIFKKVSVRFISNKYILENFKPKLFSQAKKMIPINSRAHEDILKNKMSKQQKYIVFLDHSLNHPEWVEARGIIEKKFEKEIYKLTENFLLQLSNLYKKKVVVCLHPSTNKNNIKNLLKKFKIVKFKTPEYIYKSELVVFSDSSSIVDAFILKKKIVCIKSLKTNLGEIKFLKNYHNLGLLEIDLDNKVNLKKNKIDIALKNALKKYSSFNRKFTQLDKNEVGSKKLIKYIKNVLV